MLKNINSGASNIYSLTNTQNQYIILSVLGKYVVIPVISYFCLSPFVISARLNRSVSSINYIVFS